MNKLDKILSVPFLLVLLINFSFRFCLEIFSLFSFLFSLVGFLKIQTEFMKTVPSLNNIFKENMSQRYLC